MSFLKNKLSLKTFGLVYPFEYDFKFTLKDRHAEMKKRKKKKTENHLLKPIKNKHF